MEIILLTVLFIAILIFLYFWQDKRDKAEKSRFREFVIASKSKNLDEYATTIPEENESLPEQPDELVELSDEDPERILKAIKNSQDEDNEY